MSSKSIPKNIAALVAREAELQSAVDRWSVDSFRAERDRQEKIIRGGAATDAEIEDHANSRDGGKLDSHYQSMAASSSAALEAFKLANWETFRAYLRTRLAERRKREAAIASDIQSLRDLYGIWVDYRDPEWAATQQLDEIISRDSPFCIRFGGSLEAY